MNRLLSNFRQSDYPSRMNEAPGEATEIESHQSESAHDKPGSLYILWVFLALLTYLLSIGPAVKLVPPTPSATKAVEVFYWPVLYLGQTCRPVHVFLRWYLLDVWHCK